MYLRIPPGTACAYCKRLLHTTEWHCPKCDTHWCRICADERICDAHAKCTETSEPPALPEKDFILACDALNAYLKTDDPHLDSCRKTAVMTLHYYKWKPDVSENEAALKAYKQFQWDLCHKAAPLNPASGMEGGWWWNEHTPKNFTTTDLYLRLKSGKPVLRNE